MCLWILVAADTDMKIGLKIQKKKKKFSTDYTDSAEPYNFAQQAGVFEVHTLRTAKQTNRVLTQVVPEPPIDTCKPKRMPSPVTLIGNSKW